MRGPFFIACLKYAPGMWQFMSSFARRLLQQGHEVRFLLSPGFRWMTAGYAERTNYVYPFNKRSSRLGNVLSYLWFPRSYYQRLFQHYRPSGLLLASWHPLNFAVARMVKSIDPKIPIIVWLHEPYKDEKRLYGAKAIIIYLVELFQTLSLRYADVVILHSHRAQRLFEQRYPKFQGRTYRIPLQFQDDGLEDSIPRRYLSFLGRADRAKGIELFIALIEEFTPTDTGLEFQIVTSSDIQAFLEALSPQARQGLRVINRPQVADQDLREAAANSLAVLALYKETTQSGVIPLALMQGTPIIGTDIEGITEWIRAGETGVIVSRNPSAAEIEKAAIYIQSHLTEMTANCRAEYLATFDDRNWGKQYGWMLDLIKP
ncbi:MAG: glycosyltransferase family 4 protein [Desulfobaccales bacterium]